MTSNWNETEFLEISSICGFDISSEDIEALSKRKLISAWSGGVFGRPHLFLLTVYFDAITVHRHPWSVRNSETTLQDVKRLNSEISLLDPNIPNENRNHEVAQSCRLFLDKIDPFGPITSVINMLDSETLYRFKNSGRLSCELSLLLSELEANTNQTDAPFTFTAAEQDTLAPERDTLPPDDDDTSGPDHDTLPPIVEKRTTEDAPALVFDTPAPTMIQATLEPPTEIEVKEPTEVLEEQEKVLEAPENTIPKSLVVEGPDAIDGDTTIPVSLDYPISVDESAEMILTDMVEDSKAKAVGIEESSVDISSRSDEENPFIHNEKTNALINRLKLTSTENQKDIEKQIQSLNAKREGLIANQDWLGLADLYEEKIDLFEGAAERQEVLLTLATLHELKLKNPRRAVTFFQLCIENGTQAGLQKAYEGMQRVGSRPDLKAFCSAWLQARSNNNVNDFEMPHLQLSNSNFLRECGKPHRAFLSYAAYLTRDPEKNVDEHSLKNLEKFAEKIEDSELESFYTDILDFENESLDYSSTRSLIAKRAGLFYTARDPMLAVKYLRVTLDKNPNDEESYLAISHIYQEEGNWPDLIHLASKRYKHLKGQDRIRAAVELEQFIAEDLSDKNALERYYEWAKLDPDSWAIEGLIAAMGKNDRLVEGYPLLKNLVANVKDIEKQEKIYLSLAQIALNQFELPEDAISHYQAGLALTEAKSTRKAKLLEGLALLQIKAAKWEPAIDTLEKLTIEPILAPEHRLEWLKKAALIAEQAGSTSKFQLFKSRILELESQ